MKGIKLPSRKLATVSSSDARLDADGVFHMRLQEMPSEKKRPREIISLDSLDGISPNHCINVDDHSKETVKKPRISRPGATQSPHFPRLDTVTTKPTVPRNPLEREIAARGLSPSLRSAEHFAEPYTDQSSILAGFGFTGPQKPIPRIPGDQTQRRHGLIQPTTFYTDKPSVQVTAAQTQFELGFAKVKGDYFSNGGIWVQVDSDRLRFRQTYPDVGGLSRVSVNDVRTIKVMSFLVA